MKFWIKDIKFAHERCVYCGWYLHPQILFKGITSPMKMVYWKEPDNNFVCSKCHYLYKTL